MESLLKADIFRCDVSTNLNLEHIKQPWVSDGTYIMPLLISINKPHTLEINMCAVMISFTWFNPINKFSAIDHVLLLYLFCITTVETNKEISFLIFYCEG